MTDNRIVIIGGSAAGPKAASRARRLNGNAEIVILQRDMNLSMSTCAYPYYVSNTIRDRRALISTPAGQIRDTEYFMQMKNIIVRTGATVTSIDPAAHVVRFTDTKTGADEEMEYSKLIIATGSTPRMPNVPGVELEGVAALHSLEDADNLRAYALEKGIEKAVIIGGGSIGLEVCEALSIAGMSVTIVEAAPHIMNSMDPEMSMLLERFAKTKIGLYTGNSAVRINGSNGVVSAVELDDGTVLDCGLVVMAAGVVPNTGLAKNAGILLGESDGIVVNQFMQTSEYDIYAAGDCVESRNFVSGGNVYSPFGDEANLQGRVAGENAAVGNRAMYTGTAQSFICKFFNYTVGSTGLTEKAALERGYEIETVIYDGIDRPGFMGGKNLITKLVMERLTDRFIGAQCVGTGDLSRHMSVFAVAVKGGLGITDMTDIDLPYSPVFSQPIDAAVEACHLLMNKRQGYMKSISSIKLMERLEKGENLFLLDVRNPEEFAMGHVGFGIINIPLPELRDRLAEIPEGKKTEIICCCQIGRRAFEGARILMNNGWRNVLVLEGGLSAWPYRIER